MNYEINIQQNIPAGYIVFWRRDSTSSGGPAVHFLGLLSHLWFLPAFNSYLWFQIAVAHAVATLLGATLQ